MKTDELIESINRERDLFAEQVGDCVKVYDGHENVAVTIPQNALSFFDITWNCMQPRFAFDEYERETLENVIGEYLETRVEKRSNDSDRYYLEFFDKDNEMIRYVESIENNDSGFSFKYGEQTIFKKEELDELKHSYPYLADLIDEMKVSID